MTSVDPLELNPDKASVPEPLSLPPAKKRKRHSPLWPSAWVLVALSLAVLALSLNPLFTPRRAILCYPQTPVQGGTLELRLNAALRPERLSCEFAGETYPFYRAADGGLRALVPVQLFARPVLHYAVVYEKTLFSRRVLARVPVAVRRGNYPRIKLTLHTKSTQSKADREMFLVSARQILLTTLAGKDPEQHWRGHFIYPLRGRITAPYGERRIVNGRPGSVHYGLDIGAPEGTDIVAANTGLVALTGNFPLQGKIVLLNHGQGVFTAYLHMSEIIAQEGTVIKQGQLLGRTGSTGRSTGPHLHWGAYLHGVPVNPLEWLDREI